MGKYEKLSAKIEANEHTMQTLQSLDVSAAQSMKFPSVDANEMYNARKLNKLQRKNEKLQEKKAKIDAKLDAETKAVNDSLQKFFGEDIQLPDKDSPTFQDEAQSLITEMKQKINDDPQKYKNFVNDMRECPTKAEVAVSSMHPIALAKAIAFRKKHPDIANLVDAGFRVHGKALDRKHFDTKTNTITDRVDVSSVEISFDPSGKIGRNFDHHQENDIQMTETGNVNYAEAKTAYQAAKDEQKQAKKFTRQRKRNNDNDEESHNDDTEERNDGNEE